MYRSSTEGVMQWCLSKLKGWLLGMLANGLIRQRRESLARVEWIGIVKDSQGWLNTTSSDWVRLKMTRISSLVALFLVRNFFPFKHFEKLLIFSFSCLFLIFFPCFLMILFHISQQVQSFNWIKGKDTRGYPYQGYPPRTRCYLGINWISRSYNGCYNKNITLK